MAGPAHRFRSERLRELPRWKLRYLHLGSGSAPNRIFNIEWRTVLFADNNATQNHEVRLYENDPNLKFEVIIGTLHAQRDRDMGVGRTGQLGSWVLHTGLLHSCRWQPAYERLAQLRDTTVCLAISNADGSACDADSNANGDVYAECDTIAQRQLRRFRRRLE